METKTMNKKEAMYQRIEKHGNDLNKIFNTGLEPVALCKKLLRLENKAHAVATGYRNGDITEDDQEVMEHDIGEKMVKILKMKGQIYPLFFNRAPRGYCLKLDDEWVRDNDIQIHKDWGGYGIIAPDFSEV